MDDHDPARGDVEMGSGGQPQPTVSHVLLPAVSGNSHVAAPASHVLLPAVSGNSVGGNRPQMDDPSATIGNPRAYSSARVVKDDPKPLAGEQWASLLEVPSGASMRGVNLSGSMGVGASMRAVPYPPVLPPELLSGSFPVTMRREFQSNQATVGSGSCCIYEIPRKLRRVDEEAYEPLVVALGPLFRYYRSTMKIIEAQKWSYLREALSASGDADEGLENLLLEVRNLEQRARECYYSERDLDLDSNAFVRMMVLDGCFVLQILLKETNSRPISSDDPIFHQRWLFHKVKRDMMLLPNQIPFFVLQSLFDLLAPPMGITISLFAVVRHFFEDRIKGPSLADDNPKHLLHFLDSNLFPNMDGRKAITNLKPFPGATHLRDAGVEFESSRADRLDITFEGGVLKIPHFSVQDDTKSLFLNLKAFEQLHPHSRPHVTAYTFFMHCLIYTAEDVSILCRKGVIDNWLGRDQEVADLFGQLGRDITIYPNEVYMADVIEGIHKYCGKRSNTWRASFIHDYVRKPWGIVSLTAAIILLILTFIQSFFAVFSYFQPPS